MYPETMVVIFFMLFLFSFCAFIFYIVFGDSIKERRYWTREIKRIEKNIQQQLKSGNIYFETIGQYQNFFFIENKGVNFTGKVHIIAKGMNISHNHLIYMKNGQIHREDGPAYVNAFRGIKVYYLEDDEFSSKEKWFEALSEEQQEKLLWHLNEV